MATTLESYEYGHGKGTLGSSNVVATNILKTFYPFPNDIQTEPKSVFVL